MNPQQLYFDTSDLNAPYDKWPPRMEVGAGVLTCGDLGSLGALGQADPFPWGEYSTDTEVLQRRINEVLAAHNYCPLTVDGKLGKRTCGAANMAMALEGEADSLPAACNDHVTEWIAPSQPPCGGSAPPSTPSSPPNELVRAQVSSGGGSWLIYGGLIAAGAIGLAIYSKKRSR